VTDPRVAEAAAILGGRAVLGVPLGPLTTYRVGGPAALLVADAGPADLSSVAAAVGSTGLDVLVVGRGSNLLVAEAGFPGIVVVLGEAFAEVRIEGTTVEAGGAAALPVVARRTAAAGLTGFEWAVGVPGSIGGAVRMNAGGHGSDMAASLTRVRVLDLRTGEDGWMVAAALQLGYRRSRLRASEVVTAVELQLAPGDAEVSDAEVASIVRWRRANQPGGANAGSVFTNPPGDSAGRLVEAAGCKGLTVGGASVSERHANFVVTRPGATAADVVAVIAEVQRRVREHAGIDLHPEVVRVPMVPVRP
jgi:UDP-N-acetylmuramate dehydrogenase